MHKKDIFISYSSTQSELAFAFRNFIEKQGISCWIAPDCISSGDDYSKAIPDAIKNCSAVLLIFSDPAQESKWVKKEIESAINLNKKIIAVSIDNFSVNAEFEFYLSAAEIFRLHKNKKETLYALVNEINSILSREPANISDDEIFVLMEAIRKNSEFLGSFLKGASTKMKIFSLFCLIVFVLPFLLILLSGGFQLLKFILFPPKFY